MVQLDDAGMILRLENFKATNGPDLYMYLASDSSTSDFVNLGRLKGNIGNRTMTYQKVQTFQNMILSLSGVKHSQCYLAIRNLSPNDRYSLTITFFFSFYVFCRFSTLYNNSNNHFCSSLSSKSSPLIQ